MHFVLKSIFKKLTFILMGISVCSACSGQPAFKEGPRHHQQPAGEEAELHEGEFETQPQVGLPLVDKSPNNIQGSSCTSSSSEMFLLLSFRS